MARFFIHQGFEDLEHLLGQEFGLHGDLEDAEAQEGIHAFAEAEILEAGFDIVADIFQRTFGGIDAVFLDHHPDHLGVAGFFQALQRHGFLQHRIGDGFGEGGDDRAGAALGIENLFPEGHGFQPRQRRLVQLRPGQRIRIELGIGLHEMAAEGVAMFERSDFHAATFFFFGPMNFSASRAMKGTKRGRFRRWS